MTEDWDGRIRRNMSVGFLGKISTGGMIVEIAVWGVDKAIYDDDVDEPPLLQPPPPPTLCLVKVITIGVISTFPA